MRKPSGQPDRRPDAHPEERPARRPLRDEEPFATIREHPRRFGWGVPAVILVSVAAAFPLTDRSLSLAIAVQLVLQTAGLLWLYIPPARERWRREREVGGREGEEGSPESSGDHGTFPRNPT